MYTIVMDDSKQLITTVETYLYQRESLVDKIQFLLPQTYCDIDLSDFTVCLEYIDQANVPHTEVLIKDEEIYKNKLRYVLPIDTSITKFAGDITIKLSCTKVDLDEKKQYVIHSGESIITILPLKDYYAFVPDESLDFVDQLVGDLNAKIAATEKIAETYDKSKADNITYEENKIQLTSNGEKIGNAIKIIDDGTGSPGVIDTEFDVVEF